MTIDTTHALEPLEGPNRMTRGEADVLDLLNALQRGGPAGGAALVRLRADLEQIIQGATFPALTVIWGIDDDFEPDEEGYRTATLRCPTCGGDVDEGGLVAVDNAERWTYPSEIVPAGGEAEGGEIVFHFDGDADFGDTLYYLHEAGKPHAVALPEGWGASA